MTRTDDPMMGELALRFAADMLSLWRLCSNSGCRRAQHCRGDIRFCAERVGDWFDAVTGKKEEGSSFDEMEERLQGTQLTAFRRWKKAVWAAVE